MHVALILEDHKGNTFSSYATQEVTSCFKEKGIPHSLLHLSDLGWEQLLFTLQQASPRWTLSFSHLSQLGRPFCDVVRIPHLFWMEGSGVQAIPYLGSTFGKVGLSHEALLQHFQAPNFFFLPFGVQKGLSSQKRSFECLFFADLIAPPLQEKMYQDPSQCHQKDLRVVERFQNTPLHVFGAHCGERWRFIFPKNIHLHTPLSFGAKKAILEESLLLLAEPSSPWYWQAIASGCLPIAPDPQNVQYYLAHPQQREQKLQELQQGLEMRSWEKQINQMLETML